MAKSSASPGCSARAAPRRRGWCSAPSAPIAAGRGSKAQPVRLHSPRDAVRHGFGYCPGRTQDRRHRCRPHRAREHRAGAAGQARSRPAAVAIASRTRSRRASSRLLDIRPPDPERPIGLLSGGNQQKVLLARWLATAPRLLVLDEPTRGIDVGAHAEIIRLIRELCDDGLALLVISSELDEIVTYSDRVVVLRDRAHVDQLAGRGHRRYRIFWRRSPPTARRRGERPAMTASPAAPRPRPDPRADSSSSRSTAWCRRNSSTCGCRTAGCSAA